MHKDWCGKPCSECRHPCHLDEMLPCSPDCENLGPDGEPDPGKCESCEVYTEIILMGYVDGEEEDR